MNSMADTSILANQGALFWVACGAVALGLTMLVTALVVQVRRLFRRHEPTETATPAPVVTEVEVRQAYARAEVKEERKAAPVRRRVTDTRDNDRLVVLLSRLEEAAARLEKVAAVAPPVSPVENSQSPADSDLKEQADGVEYVFRAAGG